MPKPRTQDVGRGAARDGDRRGQPEQESGEERQGAQSGGRPEVEGDLGRAMQWSGAGKRARRRESPARPGRRGVPPPSKAGGSRRRPAGRAVTVTRPGRGGTANSRARARPRGPGGGWPRWCRRRGEPRSAAAATITRNGSCISHEGCAKRRRGHHAPHRCGVWAWRHYMAAAVVPGLYGRDAGGEARDDAQHAPHWCQVRVAFARDPKLDRAREAHA